MFEYPIEIGNDDLDAAVRLRHCIDFNVLVGNDLLVVLQLVTRRQRVRALSGQQYGYLLYI